MRYPLHRAIEDDTNVVDISSTDPRSMATLGGKLKERSAQNKAKGKGGPLTPKASPAQAKTMVETEINYGTL